MILFFISMYQLILINYYYYEWEYIDDEVDFVNDLYDLQLMFNFYMDFVYVYYASSFFNFISLFIYNIIFILDIQ